MPHPNQEADQKRRQLAAAQAELAELQELVRTFGARVDDRLGKLLDQLSQLNLETASLDGEVRTIREKRLYGEELIQYADGAPRPARPPSQADLPAFDISPRGAAPTPTHPSNSPRPETPDIKTIYRRLARLYHPDLARSETDRIASNEHMAEVNRLFQEGDLPALMKLAGMSVAPESEFAQPPTPRKTLLTALEKIEAELASVRQEIARLNSLPLVKLSLDVKLARHQRRDLLAEMAADLQLKVKRKIAERDYLTAQINASRRATANHLG